MYVLFLIILIVIIICAYFVDRKVYNPVSLVSIIWALIVYSFIVNKNEYIEIKPGTTALLLIGVISLIFGCVIGMYCISSVQKNIEKKTSYYINLPYNQYIIGITTVVSIAIFLTRDIAFVRYLLSGHSWEEARYAFIFIYIATRTSHVNQLLTVYVATPIATLNMFLLSYRIIQNKGISKIDLLLIVNIVTLFLSDGNRLTIATLGICIAINYLLTSNINFTKKQKRIALLLIILILTIFVYFTARRGKFIYQVTSYLGGSIPFFQQLNEKRNAMTYGLYSFQGFLKPIGELIELIFNIDIFKHVTESYDLVQGGLSIGHTRINSVTTMFYSFYYDFDILGVILLSIIIGFVIGQAYRAAQRVNSFWTNTVFVTGVLIISYSFLMFLFVQISYGMAFIYMYIFGTISNKISFRIVGKSVSD